MLSIHNESLIKSYVLGGSSHIGEPWNSAEPVFDVGISLFGP
jgi:hypothetical protein